MSEDTPVPRKKISGGFTLIELMIVVAIIGILAAIAMPKFADFVRKSGEGASKGSLGAIRSALNIYYADLEGEFPDTLTALTGKYIQSIPVSKTPNYHADTSVTLLATVAGDAGGWLYNNTIGSQSYGGLFVNCSHTDTKSSVWSTY